MSTCYSFDREMLVSLLVPPCLSASVRNTSETIEKGNIGPVTPTLVEQSRKKDSAPGNEVGEVCKQSSIVRGTTSNTGWHVGGWHMGGRAWQRGRCSLGVCSRYFLMTCIDRERFSFRCPSPFPTRMPPRAELSLGTIAVRWCFEYGSFQVFMAFARLSDHP